MALFMWTARETYQIPMAVYFAIKQAGYIWKAISIILINGFLRIFRQRMEGIYVRKT
jgi:hypothetical protein